MFKITDAEKLRDAYTLLAFIRDDVPTTTAEQKSGMVAAFMVSIKKEIRAYNNRPVSNVRIISADYDGRLELVQLPDELDKAHKADAANWFRNNCYLEAYNSQYDCTGQEFTSWYKLFRRQGHWFAYHLVSRDV